MDETRNIFINVTYRSGLSFEVSDNGEIQGKYVGGLAEGTHLTAVARMSGLGLVCC
jgi:hypothetical protein